MARVESPPAGREAPVARALVLPVVVMAGATAAAAALVAEPAARPALISRLRLMSEGQRTTSGAFEKRWR